jgi:hypothetical protein
VVTIIKPEETIPPAIAALGLLLVASDPRALSYDTPLRKSVDPPPENLDTAQLPCLWAFTGEGEYDFNQISAENVISLRRIWRIQVACLTTAEGTPFTRETRVRPILTKTRDHFAGYPTLNGAIGVRNALITGDSGVAILPEYEGRFIGFQIDLTVDYIVARLIAGG